MTAGSDYETDELSSPNVLKRITEELESERFQFKPTRRQYIPKANGFMRPLGIPSPRDKIVQKAMAILLELIYEPEFLAVSHGFRPKRGCHTAMKQINQWKGMKWAIEGDIKGFFDNVDHPLLVKLLEKKIKDQQFIDLIHKLIKAGYVEGGLKRDSILGVPQGGIISPILSNIVLHELDRYITDLIEAKSKKKSISTRNPKSPSPYPLPPRIPPKGGIRGGGDYPKESPLRSGGGLEGGRGKYDKPTRRIQYLRDKYNDVKNRPLEIQEEIKNLIPSPLIPPCSFGGGDKGGGKIKERNSIPSTLSYGNRIKYIRYADD